MIQPVVFCRVALALIALAVGQTDMMADEPAVVNLFQPIPELTLRTGRVLKNVQVVAYATTSLSARWDGGAGTIDYKLLPDNIRAEAELNRPEKPPANHQKSNPQKMSYKDYLKKHPTPAAKKSSVPRIDGTGISQGSATAPPHQFSKDSADASHKKKEARRVELAKEIARHQSMMDAYDRQNTVKTKGENSVTDEQYERAKAARDKAQAERDELAR